MYLIIPPAGCLIERPTVLIIFSCYLARRRKSERDVFVITNNLCLLKVKCTIPTKLNQTDIPTRWKINYALMRENRR